MIRYFRPCLLVSLCLLCGCNEIWLKRGGTPQDMDMAQAECRKTSGDPRGESPAFLTCMQGKGWAMHRLGLAAQPAAVAGDEAAATVGPNPGSIPAQTDTASPPAQPGSTPAQAPQHSSVAGKTHLVISSWWKLGAAPDDLEKAERQCVSQPGVIHRPDPGSDIVTA